MAEVGTKDWWLGRYVTHGDVRRPWYELTDEERAALSAPREENRELREIINLLVNAREDGRLVNRWREGADLGDVVPNLTQYVTTHREQRIAQLKAELAKLEEADG